MPVIIRTIDEKLNQFMNFIESKSEQIQRQLERRTTREN